MEYKQAKEIAIKLLRKLEQVCVKSDIVGSIRREKSEVHDMEIIVVPRKTEVTDLFGEVIEEKRIPTFCDTVRTFGKILKGDIEKGRYVQIELPERITLDLFIPLQSDFERQKAIRTGSSEYSHKVIANGWIRSGWAGTKEGLRLQKECYQKVIGTNADGKEKKEWICNNPNPTMPPVWQNEVEFFNFIGVEWIEPKYRSVC